MSTPSRWEYRVVQLGRSLESEVVVEAKELETRLNRAGAEGWDLCAVVNGGFVFKRVAPPKDEAK